MSVIELAEVSKSYRGRLLYRDVSFAIERGSFTAVSGPNGAGKSVLFRLMCGFVTPDEGTVKIDPAYLSVRRTFPERFGVIIDRPGYLAHRTGIENLRELASIRRVIDEEQIRETMVQVGLDPNLRQRVRHYSLGMKQKLALAQALMEQPDVLILYEPFNALDERSVATTKHILRALHERGATIVFASHNRADVEQLATHRLLIDGEAIRAE